MASSQAPSNGSAPVVGPHPSHLQVAKPYVFEQKLQECMTAIGVTEAKEDLVRLQGVTWIDNVRKALQLPVRTYNTAVVYYHKFRLMHPEGSYDFREAAAAALFAACKIEDTLKKSRDILCAAHNMKLPAAEHLSPDDPSFEATSRNIVVLERFMLEASGFDFRNRYPQKLLMKLLKSCQLERDTVGLTAYNISLDLYRTFAPLKQTTQTMAQACLELAVRLCEIDLSAINSGDVFDYDRWATTRPEIMETLVDLLDLYTHHRTATVVGPSHTLDTFIAIRINLNQEASAADFPRYTNWKEVPANSAHKKSTENSGAKINGTSSEPSSAAAQSPSNISLGERGKEGTVRFMLDPGRARAEKAMVQEYFRTEEIEEEIEIDVDVTDSSYEFSAKQETLSTRVNEHLPASLKSETYKEDPSVTSGFGPDQGAGSSGTRRRLGIGFGEQPHDEFEEKAEHLDYAYRDLGADTGLDYCGNAVETVKENTKSQQKEVSKDEVSAKRPANDNPNMIPLGKRPARRREASPPSDPRFRLRAAAESHQDDSRQDDSRQDDRHARSEVVRQVLDKLSRDQRSRQTDERQRHNPNEIPLASVFRPRETSPLRNRNYARRGNHTQLGEYRLATPPPSSSPTRNEGFRIKGAARGLVQTQAQREPEFYPHRRWHTDEIHIVGMRERREPPPDVRVGYDDPRTSHRHRADEREGRHGLSRNERGRRYEFEQAEWERRYGNYRDRYERRPPSYREDERSERRPSSYDEDERSENSRGWTR